MATKPSTERALEGVFELWVKQLCFTWLWVLLLSVMPAVLFGSGIFSIGVLAVAVLVGAPSALLGSATKDSGKKVFRRLAVMLVVPASTLTYVFQADEQIPVNAAPLIEAIESFRLETEHYPESLEAIIPKHLAKIPEVRFSVIQPLITYKIKDGKPSLAIPSARGDMFAQYKYDFETKAWIHHS